MPALRLKIHAPRGFTITEILITLSLLVIFFATAGEVFRSTILLGKSSQDVCDTASQIDSALRQLRIDAWNARAISVPDPRSAQISLADGATITWQLDAQNSAVRTDAARHAQQWNEISARWSFAADAHSLVVSDGKSAPQRIISQILLTNGPKP
jgi:prepilin-type N-terminal cleavage/methylation domain-containing protein